MRNYESTLKKSKSQGEQNLISKSSIIMSSESFPRADEVYEIQYKNFMDQMKEDLFSESASTLKSFPYWMTKGTRLNLVGMLKDLGYVVSVLGGVFEEKISVRIPSL
jgi:hypothetical protein